MRRLTDPAWLSVVALAGPFVVGYRLSRGDRATRRSRSRRSSTRCVRRSRRGTTGPCRRRSCSSVRSTGCISALGDPYTAYLAPADYRLVRQETASRYSGIGVERAADAARPRRRLAAAGAGRAGGRARRRHDRAHRRHARRVGLDAVEGARARSSAPRGTHVRLVLDARGHERVRRRRAPRHRAGAARCRRGCSRTPGGAGAIVRLAGFRAGAAGALAPRAAKRSQRQGASGFVLDLRQNPGRPARPGGRRVVALPQRGVVVSLVGAHNPQRSIRAAERRRDAPAARRARRPLQRELGGDRRGRARDNHRATLVGERTFGKALVQSIDPLDNGAALELTVARYYDACGDGHLGRRRRPADPRGRRSARRRRTRRSRGAARARPARLASSLSQPPATVAAMAGRNRRQKRPSRSERHQRRASRRGSRSPS